VSHLRNRKQTYVGLVRIYAKQGKLSAEEAEGFDLMFRRARSQVEQHRVYEILMDNINRLNTAKDRYGMLHRDDLLDLD